MSNILFIFVSDDVTFHRSWEPYARGYIVMQVILNLAGFAAFWLPVQCGERMGLTITSLLAAVASELVVSANLPSSSEMTWFQRFSLFSLAFGAIPLFESAAVIFFFYYTGSDLKPTWWKWLQAHVSPRLNSSIGKRKRSAKNSDSKDQAALSVDDDGPPENGIAVDVSVDAAESSQDDHVTSQDDHVSFKNDEAAPFTSTKEEASTKHRRRERSNSIARDADDFVDDLEAINNKRWKKVAVEIDEICRVIVFPAYSIILIVFLQAVDRM